MPTASPENPLISDIDGTAERVRESSKRFVDVGRKVSTAYLDGIEKYLAGLTDFERSLAAQTQLEPVAKLLNAHAALADAVTKASVSGARELIQAS